MSAWFPTGLPGTPDRLLLLCLPFAGGGASAFRSWQGAFGPGIDVVPVQLPGRESRFREKPYDSMPDLVTALLRELAPLRFSQIALFGYSMGALIAFNLALAMQNTGRAPAGLFVAAHRAPHRRRKLVKLHELDSASLWKALSQMGGTPPPVLESAELRQVFEPLLRADLALIENCPNLDCPAPVLDIPLAAFGGTSDMLLPKGELAAWRDVTTGQFSIKLVPGGHFVLGEAALRGAIGDALHELLPERQTGEAAR